MAGIPLSSLLIFTNQFAAMISSQLPLVDVLKNLARETPQRKFRDVLDDVVDDVEHGADLGDALAQHRHVFDDIYINVVRAGMGSGRLEDALVHLANYLGNADVVSKKVRSAMTYPVMVIGAFFVAFNAMTFFILPRFAKVFQSFGSELPVPTQIMMDLGDIWQQWWYIFGLVLVMGIGAFVLWIATPQGRLVWDEVKLDIPIVGRIWRLGALARFLRTFAVQVRNEVEILKALELAAPSSGNRYIENVLMDIADDIESGMGIAQSFREHDVFSGIVLQMISAGEESSSLDELLLSAADYFDRILDEQVQQWTSMINPILTVVIGLLIGGMMVAVFMPVFEMGKSVGH
ncbi:MAG: type II secretion system F family protein [Gammaproteobacteria bacterium]